MSELPELLRVSDVAGELGVTAGRIYQLLRVRELPSVRIGGAIRIPKDAWRAWLNEQRDRALETVRRPQGGGPDAGR